MTNFSDTHLRPVELRTELTTWDGKLAISVNGNRSAFSIVESGCAAFLRSQRKNPTLSHRVTPEAKAFVRAAIQRAGESLGPCSEAISLLRIR